MIHSKPHTLEEVLATIQIDLLDASFPKIFDLPKEEGQGTTEDRLVMLSRTLLKDRPALVVQF